MGGLVYTHDDFRQAQAIYGVVIIVMFVVGIFLGYVLADRPNNLNAEQERKAYYAARFEQSCAALQFYEPMNEAPETPMKVRDNE